MLLRSKRNAGFILSMVLALVLVCATAYAVDRVIVVVNDEVITQREFDRVFDRIKAQYEANFKGEELEKRLEAARKGVLQQMINSKLASSIAKSEDIKVDEALVDEQIETIQKNYPSKEEFLKALSDRGTNLTELKKDITDHMLAQKVVEKEVAQKVVITPAEIEELYASNKDKMVAPEMYKVRTMMTKKSEDSKPSDDKKRLEGMIKEYKKTKDFGKVAAEKSEGPFAQRNGDLGPVMKGQLAPPLENAIFETKEGKLSEIVETPIGYHVFLVEEIQPSRQLEFAEVSDYLRQQLQQKKFQEEMIKWIQKKRENAHISYK